MLTDKPPALEGEAHSKMAAPHLNAMHSAKKAFIEKGPSEKIRRALQHQIRVSGNVK